MPWRATSRAGSNSPGWRSAFRRTTVGASSRAAPTSCRFSRRCSTPRWRRRSGTLEFDARQRAYGGHMQAGLRGELSNRAVAARHEGRSACSRPDAGARHRRRSTRSPASWRSPSSGPQFLAEREAAELVRQKADLAATLLASLSHDLRTPLTAIKVAVENLRGDLPADDRRAQAAAAIRRDRSAGAAVPGHPRHGADRCRRRSSSIAQWVSPADVVDAAIAHVAARAARASAATSTLTPTAKSRSIRG